MKNFKLLIPLLLFASGAFAQGVKIAPWQLWKGTPGNIVIIGVDSFQKDTANYFLAAADTADLHNQIVLKQNLTDTATWDATKANLNAGLALKENLSNKATDLSTSNNTLYPTTKAAKDNDISAVGVTGTTTKTITLTRPNGNLTANFTDNNTTYTAGHGMILSGTTFRVDTTKVTPLDAGGKVPFQYLPATLMIYKGVWNASTNSPALSDGMAGVPSGWVYKASPGGTVNFGAGNTLTFADGDWAIYNGTKWEKSTNSNAVVSVNGYQGIVNLTTTDIPEGTSLYFTDTRARNSVSAVGDLSYNPSTGVFSYSTPANLPPSGTAGGDLSGSYPNPTVAKLNGQLPSYYLDRTNHTGAQAISTVTGLQTALDSKANESVNITAGNGLTGGGDLSANRTLTLGTPSNVTLSSTNSVTTSSHTHAFVPGGTSGQYIRGDGQLANLSPIATLSVAEEDFTGASLTGGTTYTLAHTPSSLEFFEVYYRGVLLKYGTDYTISSNQIIFTGTMDHITPSCSFNTKYRW